jgi:hypothetical protein
MQERAETTNLFAVRGSDECLLNKSTTNLYSNTNPHKSEATNPARTSNRLETKNIDFQLIKR